MEINNGNVSFFAELMNKYGVAIVISAVVIILFIIFVVNDRKTIKKSLSDPMSNFTNAMMDSVTQAVTNSIRHPNAKESNQRDEVDLEIKNVLKELIKRTESDRAYVFLYHNGGVSVSGFSFNKMTIISEADGPGIKFIAPENQGVQRGPYAEIIQQLRDNTRYFVPDVEVLKESDPIGYAWFTERASRASYLRAIKDHDKQVIGFFGIDYVSVHDMPEEEAIMLKLERASTAIASLVIAGKYFERYNNPEVVVK